MKKGKTLYIDYSRCIGCESCEAICKFLYGVSRIQMTRAEDGHMFPLYCHHCQVPLCSKGCPEGVISKQESGVVLVDYTFARECDGEATMAYCPFCAVFPAGGNTPVVKCDLCIERLDDDMPPACAQVCPNEAIFLVNADEESKMKTDASEKAWKKVLRHIKALRRAKRAVLERM